MIRDLPADMSRKLRAAKRLADEALSHFATGDEMQAEARRLLTEALAIEAGERRLARSSAVLRDLRH